MCEGGDISHCKCWVKSLPTLQVRYTPKKSILVPVWADSTGLSVPDSKQNDKLSL